MSHIFISYARTDEPLASLVADRLREAGYRGLARRRAPAHRAYAEVIEERIKGASGGGRVVVGRSRQIAMGTGRGGHVRVAQ